MKSLRMRPWLAQAQPPRNPRLSSPTTNQATRSLSYFLSRAAFEPSSDCTCQHRPAARVEFRTRRHLVNGRRSVATAVEATGGQELDEVIASSFEKPRYTPSARRIASSAKLAALHARLALPAKFPLKTLARCLIDPTADPRSTHNNAPLAMLGQDLLGVYTAEYLLCKYPRLPMSIVFAAQYGYAGSATLASIRSEWGVETVAAPGPEVDPGLLQYKKALPAGSIMNEGAVDFASTGKTLGTGRNNENFHYRRSISSRIVYDDEFGDLRSGMDRPPYSGASISTLNPSSQASDSTQDLDQPAVSSTLAESDLTTTEAASASFVRAVAGALYLHAGLQAAKNFHKDHILSRFLQLHTLFNFIRPTRDINRLCLREGFEPPVARLISETGRLSRTPVFVVGVYSGNDKLGEGVGSSLNEGRIRASAAALRAWYLYSPPASEIMMPSDVEGTRAVQWKPQMIDVGEVIT